MRDKEFGRGQNTELGWNDPTFEHGSVPKVTRGSFQPSSRRGTVFCPRAYKEVSNSECREERISNPERRDARCQF